MEHRQLSAEAVSKLQEGIDLLLSRWTALQVAVHNEWGGSDSLHKSQQLPLHIFSWFTQSKEPLYCDDLENLLDECMLSLNTEIDDGSIEEIAEQLMVMHDECLEGNFTSIERLRETNLPRVHVPSIIQAGNDDEDSSSGEDDSSDVVVDVTESQSNLNQKDIMVVEPKPMKTAEAEEGWTVVASKRNRGRRN